MNIYHKSWLCKYFLCFLCFFHLPRHLLREMENQTAQTNRFQQQMRKLDEDIKQNEGLLRRAHMEQKSTKVTIFIPHNQTSSPSEHRRRCNLDTDLLSPF